MITLNHINIHADDLDAARDFLLAALPDLKQGFRPPFDFKGYWLYLGEQPVIHMQNRGAGMGGRGWIDHLAFAPFDLETERRGSTPAASPTLWAASPAPASASFSSAAPRASSSNFSARTKASNSFN
jgi:catechol 2,3-dioxygenase-like lactoylglutathione lyase family enzyme